MSNPITRVSPAASATALAPTTPPAGPDNTVRTACARAAPAEMHPPFDCMIESRRGSACSSVLRYRSINGVTYAFTTVVLHRSNSRYSGNTS
jgi:hypothetical protein